MAASASSIPKVVGRRIPGREKDGFTSIARAIALVGIGSRGLQGFIKARRLGTAHFRSSSRWKSLEAEEKRGKN